VIITILATIGVLGVLILVHELGHYLAARAFDIQVTRFSIGLGPKLLAFRRGETEFRLSAIPLGGYVRLAGMKEMELLEGGDEGEKVDPKRAFATQPPAVRAVVLVAGVAMNAALAVLLFALIAVVWGRPVPPPPLVGDVVEEWLPPGAAALTDLPRGARITNVGGRPVADMDEVARAFIAARPGPLTLELEGVAPVTIRVPDRAMDRQFLPLAIEPLSDAPAVLGRVVDGGPAHAAGLRPGDRVVAVNGQPVAAWQQLTRAVRRHPGETLALRIERGDDAFATTLTPAARDLGDRTVGRMDAGRHPGARAEMPRERLGPTAATRFGLAQSWDIVSLMGGFVAGLFDGRHSARELGGPILIGQISGAATRAGLPTLLFFVALLSINLAVINILPIPALDGGHLALLAVEAVRGKPTGERARAALARVGLAFVVVLMLWAVTADVMRLLGL
jgi:regulator of sigma E protease